MNIEEMIEKQRRSIEAERQNNPATHTRGNVFNNSQTNNIIEINDDYFSNPSETSLYTLLKLIKSQFNSVVKDINTELAPYDYDIVPFISRYTSLSDALANRKYEDIISSKRKELDQQKRNLDLLVSGVITRDISLNPLKTYDNDSAKQVEDFAKKWLFPDEHLEEIAPPGSRKHAKMIAEELDKLEDERRKKDAVARRREEHKYDYSSLESSYSRLNRPALPTLSFAFRKKQPVFWRFSTYTDIYFSVLTAKIFCLSSESTEKTIRWQDNYEVSRYMEIFFSDPRNCDLRVYFSTATSDEWGLRRSFQNSEMRKILEKTVEMGIAHDHNPKLRNI